MDIKDHYTTREAAEALGVSYHTLKKSRYTGLLCGYPAPSFRKLGSRLVTYDWFDLFMWLNQVPTHKANKDFPDYRHLENRRRKKARKEGS
jgi:hypothetical protein